MEPENHWVALENPLPKVHFPGSIVIFPGLEGALITGLSSAPDHSVGDLVQLPAPVQAIWRKRTVRFRCPSPTFSEGTGAQSCGRTTKLKPVESGTLDFVVQQPGRK